MSEGMYVSAPMGSIFENGLHGLSRQGCGYEQVFVNNFFPNYLFFSKKDVTSHTQLYFFQELKELCVGARLALVLAANLHDFSLTTKGHNVCSQRNTKFSVPSYQFSEKPNPISDKTEIARALPLQSTAWGNALRYRRILYSTQRTQKTAPLSPSKGELQRTQFVFIRNHKNHKNHSSDKIKLVV
ncbi:MAG: hypothetical protein FWH36_04000 [Lentimicrobiaceae bacterium]|nr:hypothetical protein [Lentimicrobiaceae bacterium]